VAGPPAGPGDQGAAGLAKRAGELAVRAIAALDAREWADALRLTRESAACYRSLAQDGDPQFVLALAAQLSNELTICMDTEQWVRAAEAGQKAVRHWRRLAKANPARKADLAVTLADLSLCYAQTDRWADAQEASADAIILYRELAQSDQERFLPRLAINLANNSIQHGRLGEHDSALAAIQEAVAILRPLARSDPAFDRNLSMLLIQETEYLTKTGRSREAVRVGTEAVDRLRALHAQRPRQFRDALASALDNLGVALSQADGAQAALPVVEEALTIIRQIQAENPALRHHAVDRLEQLRASLRASGDGKTQTIA
jgi:tetratricopeptide (TPR) repeat protein